MAEINPKIRMLGDGLLQVVWEGLAENDTGGPAKVGAYSVKTIQASGDATAITVQGSNDGVNFAAMPTPVSINATTDEIASIDENTLYVKLGAASGAGAVNTTVTLIASTHR